MLPCSVTVDMAKFYLDVVRSALHILRNGIISAVLALGALAQETRLAIFRSPVRRDPKAFAWSDIGAKPRVAPATLSFHLKELTHAGLLEYRQDGRFIYYAPDFDQMNDLVSYLTENCCGGEECAGAPTRRKRKETVRAA